MTIRRAFAGPRDVPIERRDRHGGKNKNGAGEGKWTEGPPIHFGWLAVA
jgi:hypothetical protein